MPLKLSSKRTFVQAVSSSSRLGDAQIPKKPRRAAIAQTPRDSLGEGRWLNWPAPREQLRSAREFIQQCATRRLPTIIVPDKDADGLSSAMIIYRTINTLGLPSDLLHIHFLRKGTSIFSDSERQRLEDLASSVSRTSTTSPHEVRVIVVDQGSRGGPPLLPAQIGGKDGATTIRVLVIDHHQSDNFPAKAQVLTACQSPPICTSSLLTYLACYPLADGIPVKCAWLAILGIFGDLGSAAIKFGDLDGEWPVSVEMLRLGDTVKELKKKNLSDAVALLNAPRRTPEFDVEVAWEALFKAEGPSDIVSNGTLRQMRTRINEEVERCTHVAPQFSRDGQVALLRIDSPFQIHPVIATRWAGTLKGKNLKMIMVMNPSHNPDPNLVSFSCRISSGQRNVPEGQRPDLILLLKEYGEKVGDGFLDRVGGDYARGHKEATGGIIPKDDFELLVSKGMEIGVKPDGPLVKRKGTSTPGQKSTLHDFFK